MNQEKVKQAAIEIVKEVGLINLCRSDLCHRAGIPDGSFPYVMNCNFLEFVKRLEAEGHGVSNYPVSKSRTHPDLRKNQILNAAIGLAKKQGYYAITRDEVADAAGVSRGLVSRYFGRMDKLKSAVMRAAVEQGVLEIVAQGLANGSPHAKKGPAELKARAVRLLSNL